jgi:hypothetical protein
MALPNYTQNSGGFYDPNHSYTGINQPQQFQGLSQQIYGTNESPEAAFYGYATRKGLGGMGSRAQQFQGMLPQFRRGYEAAKMYNNANLYFPEYLDQARVMDTFNNMSYEQQGLQPGRFQGRYRWQFRPGG